MRLIVDRMENGILTCVNENKSIITFKLTDYEIVDKIREGDSVIIRDNVIYVDYENTNKNRKDIDKLCKEMWDE